MSRRWRKCWESKKVRTGCACHHQYEICSVTAKVSIVVYGQAGQLAALCLLFVSRGVSSNPLTYLCCSQCGSSDSGDQSPEGKGARMTPKLCYFPVPFSASS